MESPQNIADKIRERRRLESELAPPQTGAWLTDAGDLLIRRYGDTMTATYKVDGYWLPEVALVAEDWDFEVTR